MSPSRGSAGWAAATGSGVSVDMTAVSPRGTVLYLVSGLELWTTAWGWGWVGDMGVTVSLSKKAAAVT